MQFYKSNNGDCVRHERETDDGKRRANRKRYNEFNAVDCVFVDELRTLGLRCFGVLDRANDKDKSDNADSHGA